MKFRFLFIPLLALISACVQHSNHPVEENEFNVNLQETLEYLNDLEPEKKKGSNFFYQRAKVYYKLGEFENALVDIDKSIKNDPSAPDYFLLKGRIEKARNEPKKAIENLLIAEKLGARDKDLYEILASEYLHLNQPEKAKAAVDRLVDVKSTSSSFTLKGNVLLAVSDTARAISNYEKAIKIKNSDVEPVMKLAAIFRERGELDKSYEYLKEYSVQNPTDNEVNLQKGRILVELEYYDSAKTIYNDLVAKDSTKSFLFFELSNILYAQEVYDSSSYYAQKAYLLNGERLNALLVHARSMDNLREYDSSISLYKIILEKDSTMDIASTELDILKRKVAYLWRLERLRQEKDSVRNNLPPTIEKKSIEN